MYAIRSYYDRRQHVVAHFDQLGGVARLFLRFGDDHGDVVADVAHLALREHRVRRLLHRLAFRITSYNVCYTKLLREHEAIFAQARFFATGVLRWRHCG